MAWLKGGARAPMSSLELGVPATVLTPGVAEGDASHGGGNDRGGSAKASHTAVVISPAEEPLGQVRVRASAVQAERLLAWAQAWPERTWAIEGAGAVGHLLAQQLLAAGERVLDVPPRLAARVRLLATGDINNNDPGLSRIRQRPELAVLRC